MVKKKKMSLVFFTSLIILTCLINIQAWKIQTPGSFFSLPELMVSQVQAEQLIPETYIIELAFPDNKEIDQNLVISMSNTIYFYINENQAEAYSENEFLSEMGKTGIKADHVIHTFEYEGILLGTEIEGAIINLLLPFSVYHQCGCVMIRHGHLAPSIV